MLSAGRNPTRLGGTAKIKLNPRNESQTDYGGTGKTYLYNTILAEVDRRFGKLTIAVAWNGIVATLLLEEKTVHRSAQANERYLRDFMCRGDVPIDVKFVVFGGHQSF